MKGFFVVFLSLCCWLLSLVYCHLHHKYIIQSS